MSEEKLNGGCDPSDCASCQSSCGSGIPNVPNPTIQLTLEDNSTLECAVLTTFEAESKEYIALLPLNEDGKSENGEVFLFHYSEKDGDPIIENIERNDDYMAASAAFQEFLEQMQGNAASPNES